ncbi:MAG: AmmeMemoRadiSam system protein B [Deltaproteobacteria bacterium]|nr:AmmeMemoRadiSam system protein B [Deltaproteobacteria bacterium]
MEARNADFAGSWYPGNKSGCMKAIEDFIDPELLCHSGTKRPVGGIVPHAGWIFSGKIACNVIKFLKDEEEPVTCILFGHHMHPGSSNAIMSRGRWNTPLGELEIDEEVAEKLTSEYPFTIETPLNYEQDNTIELQLPFIKYFLPECRIVPMGLPPKTASLEIARRAVEISEGMGKKTIVLGSTDLTHYGYNYGFYPKGVGIEAVEWVKNVNDRRAVDLMENMESTRLISDALENSNACCSGAAASAVEGAKALGAGTGQIIAYGTSYDVRPDSSFVGYVGVVFY